jgi:hypothetical protein
VVSEFSRQIKLLAKELEVPVVAIGNHRWSGTQARLVAPHRPALCLRGYLPRPDACCTA